MYYDITMIYGVVLDLSCIEFDDILLRFARPHKLMIEDTKEI